MKSKNYKSSSNSRRNGVSLRLTSHGKPSGGSASVQGLVQQSLSAHNADYINCTPALRSKLNAVQENVRISKESSALKILEMISQDTIFRSLSQQETILRRKLRAKETRLTQHSQQCQQTVSELQVKKENARSEQEMLEEQQLKNHQLAAIVRDLQAQIQCLKGQIDNRKLLPARIEELGETNCVLKERLRRLADAKRITNFRSSQHNQELQALQQQAKESVKICSESETRNSLNREKLSQLGRELKVLELRIFETEHKGTRGNAIDQAIRRGELEVDELNQELLIVNQNGIELDYRIKCKRKVVDRIDYDTLLEEGQTTKRSVGHMSSGEYQVNEGRKMSVRREGEDLEQEMRTGIVEERRESRAIKLAGALQLPGARQYVPAEHSVSTGISNLIHRYERIKREAGSNSLVTS